MTPYRASAEPEPEVLWSARVARLPRRRSATLVGTIGGSLAATGVALALGLPAVGGVFFAVFFGGAMVLAGKTWVFDRRLELRVERIGALHRLRVTGTPTVVSGPFVVTGSSRMTETGYLLLQLEIRGGDGRPTAIGAIADFADAAPSRDDWFDGTSLAADAPASEFMVDEPRRLMKLHEMLASLQ